MTQQIFGRFFRAATKVVFFLLAINSCKKPDTLGLETLPDSDRLLGEFTDTITVQAHILREDSLNTVGLTFNVLGSHYDPIFGMTRASLFTQFRLSTSQPDFGTNVTVDSVVLSLAYAGYYSDIMKLGGIQSFNVYRVMESFHDSAYYSNDSIPCQKFPIGTYTGFVEAKTNIFINGTEEPPQLRIKLNDNFSAQLLQAATLSTDAGFLQQIKGFCIAPVSANLLPGQGTLAYINPASAYTKLTMYYSNDDTSGLSYNFIINSGTKRFSSFSHDYSLASEITAQFADSTLGTERIFLQAMSGLKAKITFPHLNELTAGEKKIAINRAELIFNIAENTYEKLSPAARLVLIKKDSDGKFKVLDDNLYETSEFTGGFYSSDNKNYVFNIPRHLQSLINDTASDKSVYLRVSGAAVSANRVVINGPGNADKPLKLKLTYTILD